VEGATFAECADRLIAAMRPSWRNAKHAAQWETTLRKDAAPLRRLPAHTITTDDVLSVLKPLWNKKPETASRIRGRIERVLDAANTLTIEWIDPAHVPPRQPPGKPDPWRKKSLSLLRQALMNVLVEHGKWIKPWANGPSVRAVDIEIIRPEFYRGYPAAEAADAKGKQGARQRAFHRGISDAKVANLIGSWEMEGVTYVWLITPHAQGEASMPSSKAPPPSSEEEEAERVFEVLGPAAIEASCTLCGKIGDVMRIRYCGSVRAWNEECARRHCAEEGDEARRPD
jgi:hypothetical protein